MANIFNKISSIDTVDDVTASPDDVSESLMLSETAPKTKEDDDAVPDFLVNSIEKTPSKAVNNPKTVDNTPHYGWINFLITTAVIIWIITASIIAYSFFDLENGFSKFTPIQWAGLGLFVGGPVLMLLVTGYALKQLAKVSLQAHKLSISVQDLLSPDETIIGRTAVMSHKIDEQLNAVNKRVDGAVTRVATLQNTLEAQIQAIDRSSYITENKTELIASRLKEERDALASITETFDQRMNRLSHILDQQSEKLTKSTQDAEQRIQEARISVESSAAKINTASELVRENTLEAASKLNLNHDEIQRMGVELSLRAAELDQIYSKHATDLSAMIQNLRDEQETLGTTLEVHLEKMRDMSLAAQVSTKHLTEASSSGRETVQALANAARLTETAVKQRFSDMEDMVKYSNTRAESIAEKAARRVQDSLGQTRTEIARIESDMIALQDRLKDRNSLQLSEKYKISDSSETSAEAATPSLKKPKRKSISGLRPLPSENMAGSQIQPNRKSVEEAAAPKRKVSLRKRLSGLRPAPEAEVTFAEPDPEADSLDDLKIPSLRDILAAEPQAGIQKHPEPAAAQKSFPDTAPVSTEPLPPIGKPEDGSIHDLVLEVPIISDLTEPNPNQEILEFNTDMLRPIGSDARHRGRAAQPEKEHKSWWRNIFSGSGSETAAIDHLTAQARQQPAIQRTGASDAHVVISLSKIGLSPAAIVDDGCIIEAANTRISRGPLAMSDVITHRLESPVKHLYDRLQKDADLNKNIVEFARRFHTSLGEIENNREAIRSRLESDAGRAFLLCDAALNR